MQTVHAPETMLDVPAPARGFWIRALLLAVAGSLIVTVFDWQTRLGVPRVTDVAMGLQVPQGRTMIERTAFLNWQAMGILLVGLSAGLSLVAVRGIRYSFRVVGEQKKWLLKTIAFVCLLVLVAVSVSVEPGETTLLSGIEGFLQGNQSLAWRQSGLGAVAFLPMRLAVAASILAGTAMMALLILPDRIRPADLVERRERLKVLLFVCAAALAAGVLSTRSGYLWLFSFFVTNTGEPFWGSAKNLVEAGSLRVGVLYSTYLSCFYLTTAWFLRRQTLMLCPETPQSAPEDLRTADRTASRLMSPWMDQLTQFAALLAPAITGTAANFIGLKIA